MSDLILDAFDVEVRKMFGPCSDFGWFKAGYKHALLEAVEICCGVHLDGYMSEDVRTVDDIAYDDAVSHCMRALLQKASDPTAQTYAASETSE